jgi:hypothetical protein
LALVETTQQELVDPFAQILVNSYVAAAADARSFTAEWGSPPTKIDRVHRFRSIVQARVTQSDRVYLHPEYMEAGRVQVTDLESQLSYLIRSKSMIDIDEATNTPVPQQLVLFEGPRPVVTSYPSMLAYLFDRTGMRLWVCPTKQENPGRQRLVPAAELDFVGYWHNEDATTPPDGGGEGFDQGASDPWLDLGNPDIDDLGEVDGL